MPIKNDCSDVAPQLTILRIKRKRTEEPMDALLVQQEQDGKRIRKDGQAKSKSSNLPASSKGLPTLFRLAETVEEHSFKNITEAQKLKERITRRIQPGSRPQTPDLNDLKEQRVKQQMNASRQARYRVINRHRAKEADTMPPVVRSATEKAADDLFQMYEAVKDEEETKRQPTIFVDDDEEDPDDIVCNFIPMVKEYLTLNEQNAAGEESDEDYVYDVYYRDDSNSKHSIHAVNIGSLVWFGNDTQYLNDDSDSEEGDHEDEDSNAEDFYQNDYPDEESNEEYEDKHGYDLSSEDEEYY